MIAQTAANFKLQPAPVPIFGIDGECQAVIDDGYREDGEIGEWVIKLDGEIIGYAGDETAARHRYNEALRVRREHAVRSFYQ